MTDDIFNVIHNHSGRSALDMPTLAAPTDSHVPGKMCLNFIANDGDVHAIRYSPIKHFLATGGNDRKINLWDLRKAKLKPSTTFVGSNATINSIEFDSGGTLVMAASNDNSCRIWTMADNKLKHTLTGHQRKVTAAKFLIDISNVVTGSHDRTLKLWNLQTKKCLKTLSCASACNDLITLNNGAIISGHFDKKIRFWDTRSDSFNHEIPLNGKITSLEISKDCVYLLSCDRNDTIHLFDLRKNQMIRTFGNDNFKVTCDAARASMNRYSKFVAAGSSDGNIFIWNFNGALETILSGTSKAAVTAVAWDPFASFLSSTNRTRYCTIWCDVKNVARDQN